MDAGLENNLNYGESLKMLNCNLYLRICSKGAQEIILAIYCFVLFFKNCFYLLFTFRPKIGF